jgi:hypothetical protein
MNNKYFTKPGYYTVRTGVYGKHCVTAGEAKDYFFANRDVSLEATPDGPWFNHPRVSAQDFEDGLCVKIRYHRDTELVMVKVGSRTQDDC